MADEELPGGVKPYARPFSLVPPPRDRQFRTSALKAERRQRKAERRMAAALEAREDGDAPPRGVDMAELARLWGSFGYRELRRDLSPEDEERLHRQLAGVLAHEISLEVWHVTIFALNEARRAAEVPVGTRPRKWPTSYPDLHKW
jgi:hypothetical protein